MRYAIERFDLPNLMQAVDPDLEIEEAAKLFQGKHPNDLSRKWLQRLINRALDASHNWDRDIPFLRSITKMKILIKGGKSSQCDQED